MSCSGWHCYNSIIYICHWFQGVLFSVIVTQQFAGIVPHKYILSHTHVANVYLQLYCMYNVYICYVCIYMYIHVYAMTCRYIIVVVISTQSLTINDNTHALSCLEHSKPSHIMLYCHTSLLGLQHPCNLWAVLTSTSQNATELFSSLPYHQHIIVTPTIPPFSYPYPSL